MNRKLGRPMIVSVLHGCKEGTACCLCCASPVLIQLSLGMMNPTVMVGVAMVISAEKLLPRPAWIVRAVGVASILAWIASVARPMLPGLASAAFP